MSLEKNIRSNNPGQQSIDVYQWISWLEYHCQSLYAITVLVYLPLHTENFFRNLIMSTQNQIVFTVFPLIWNQTNVRLVLNQSEKGNYNLISRWFNKISKKFLFVYAVHIDPRIFGSISTGSFRPAVRSSFVITTLGFFCRGTFRRGTVRRKKKT